MTARRARRARKTRRLYAISMVATVVGLVLAVSSTFYGAVLGVVMATIGARGIQ